MGVSSQQCLFGFALEEEEYQNSNFEKHLFFQDQQNRKPFSVDDPTLFKNLLLLGSSGSGKTNVMNQIVSQVLNWNHSEAMDGVALIFDTKGDYISHPGFREWDDYVLGNDRMHRQESVTWNLFDEVLADGNNPMDYEANARELASILFKDRGSKTQPFFANAAREIFASMIIYFIRKNRDRPDVWAGTLNNKDFIEFLLAHSPADFSNYFKDYNDMNGLVTYVGDGKNNQALGVFAELRSMIYDCFQGIFCRKPSGVSPSFSIRHAIREKGGRTIFILYDLSLGETMTPIYRLLVDLALKEALSTQSNGHTHIFLDELKLLPKITHLEDALNFGRSKRVSVTAGLQSVDQIYSVYGREQGQVILSGFGSVFAFRSGDFDSRDYVSRLYGPNVQAYRYYDGNRTPVDRERDGQTVEHWHLQSLQTGQAVVGLASQTAPFLFYFERDRQLG